MVQTCDEYLSKKNTRIDLQKARIAAQAKFIRTQKTELLELHAIINFMVMSKQTFLIFIVKQ